MKLRQIASNMTEVEIGTATVLFSYQTSVAAFVEGEGWCRTDKKWSVTTSKHINKWLGSTVEVTTKPQEYFDGLCAVVQS